MKPKIKYSNNNESTKLAVNKGEPKKTSKESTRDNEKYKINEDTHKKVNKADLDKEGGGKIVPKIEKDPSDNRTDNKHDINNFKDNNEKNKKQNNNYINKSGKIYEDKNSYSYINIGNIGDYEYYGGDYYNNYHKEKK